MSKLTRFAAALLFAGLAVASFHVAAVVAQPVPDFSARQNTTQQTNYFRKLVNFDSARIANGVKFGRLPPNAYITRVSIHVVTALNGSGELTAGISASAVDLIATGDVTEASAGSIFTPATGAGVKLTSAGEQDLWVKYSGTNPTTGKAYIVVEFVPDNDQ